MSDAFGETFVLHQASKAILFHLNFSLGVRRV